MPLLEIKNLSVRFGSLENEVRAVDGVSLSIERGQSFALVGESGSGKTVLGFSLTRLNTEPQARYSGEIFFDGKNIFDLPKKDLPALRGRGVAYIFQEPSTSLNPVLRIGDQIGEAIRLHQPNVVNVKAETISLLRAAQIPEPEHRIFAYPHELSGGMQQRVVIAMALACRPKLLVADEPTTALDVTIQAQILELLHSLKKEYGMSVLLVTHNFAILKGLVDKVGVMYRGKLVEWGSVNEVMQNPQHPYT
ncbi:MAG: ABC transporter ATP-binding protein, partial [Spirochaetia bacterium]|nr:ABC transporter ATP-binding protein [Spirochaetia bacterium]